MWRIDVSTGRLHPEVGTDKIDISMGFVAAFIVQVDSGTPIVLLGGVHTGCYELFGTKRVKAIRDLKGKTVAVPALGSSHHVLIASMAAYVGIDPKRDINFVTHPVEQSAQLLAEEKVDALIGFPPVPQEIRERKIGHVIVNTGLDRPWAQYFCCIVVGNREFVRRHPVATKRAVRAIMKATNFCAAEPERAARLLANKGYRYDFERAIGVTEGARSMLLTLGCAHALGVALGARGLYGDTNFLFVRVGESTVSVFDVVRQCMDVGAARAQHAPHGVHGGDDLAVAR
jgi:NitT/TauT family transport system substrate-binding protein